MKVPYWDGKWKVGGCVAPGQQLYSARLWGFSGRGVDACAKQGIKWADGSTIPQPMRCYTQGKDVWGDIWVPDAACMSKLGPLKDEGCLSVGYRQYSAQIQNIPSKVADKLGWCGSSRFEVKSYTFSTPSRYGMRVVQWVQRGLQYITPRAASQCPNLFVFPPVLHCRCVGSGSSVTGYFYVSDACCSVSDASSVAVQATTADQQHKALGICTLPKPPLRAPIDNVKEGSTDAQVLQFLAWLYNRPREPVKPSFRVFWQGNSKFIGGMRSVVLSLAGDGQLLITDTYGQDPDAVAKSLQGSLADALVIPQVEASAKTVQQPATASGPYLIPPQPRVGGVQQGKGVGYFSLPLPNGARSQRPRLIVTPHFTGCTFVVGVANGQVHMAHIQPNAELVGISDHLASGGPLGTLLLQRGGLQGLDIGRKNFFTFGADELQGYGQATGKLVALVTNWSITLVIEYFLSTVHLRAIDISDLACRYRLDPTNPKQLYTVPFDTADCPVGGTISDCSGDPPGKWGESSTAASRREASIFVDTTRVATGSCVRLLVDSVSNGAAPVILAFENGIDQERCVTGNSGQATQMITVIRDPQKTYEFKVRARGNSNIAGKATLSVVPCP